MSEILDKAFPPEQCLEENDMLLVEEVLDMDIVNFFKVYGPCYYGKPGLHVNVESPLTMSYSEVQNREINFQALYEYDTQMADLRQKLLG